MGGSDLSCGRLTIVLVKRVNRCTDVPLRRKSGNGLCFVRDLRRAAQAYEEAREQADRT